MPTHRNTWKAFERTVGRFFGTVRNALSGRNSKVSSSDTIHPELYIECKYRATSSLHTLFNDTDVKACKEGKLPVVCTKVKGETGFLITIHSDDYKEFIERRYGITEPNRPVPGENSDDS